MDGHEPAGLPPAVPRLFRWDQQEAKAKFSEVIRRARGEGPQLVTTRGGKSVVLISAEDYAALTENRQTSFRDLLIPGNELKPARAEATAEDEPSHCDMAIR